MSFNQDDDEVVEIESEGGELTVELSRWHMREKAERAGRRRTPFLPGSSALWSEIALVVARQRGIYLAEDVDVFLGREHSLPGECRDTPVLRVRGGAYFP